MSSATERGIWRPLLAGDAAAEIREAVGDIARSLDREAAGSQGPSLQGQAGVALLFAHLHTAEPEGGYGEQAMERLDDAIGEVAARELAAQLYPGFPGIAWATEHLRGRVFDLDADDEDPNLEIDAAVRERLGVSPWMADYDLIVGLVGLGVYALERLPRPAAAECLSLLLDRLEETCERRPEGVTWLTRPELLWNVIRAGSPEGLYNLGMAHGVPGVIALLAEMCGAGVAAERARPLLASAVSWLLAQKRAGAEAEEGGFFFPGTVGPGIRTTNSRLAWCYGDVGIAAALFLAGRLGGEPAWEREAVEVALLAARRPDERTGVNDAGLCHGAAGLAHIFNRLYQASGDEELADAARAWYRRTLDYRRPGEGLGGFLTWEPRTPEAEFEWLLNPGFLSGSAGIGLALLAAVEPAEPLWDRLLLVSVPPRVSVPASREAES